VNNRMSRKTISTAVLILILFMSFRPAQNASAASIPASRITSITLSPPQGADGVTALLPYIEQEFVGRGESIYNIVVRSIDRRTGLRHGGDLVIPFSGDAGIKPVQVLFSNLFRPGSVLVLDNSFRVHEFPMGVAGDGTPFVVGGADGVVVLGPLADASIVGEATALAEAPGAAGAATLAMGTTIGGIIAVLIGVRTPPAVLQVSTFPIDDLAVIPQVGHFEFVAVTNGHLIGVNPDADERTPGLQPRQSFDLTSPLSGPHIVGIGAQIQDGTSNTFTTQTAVRIVAANRTNEIARFDIPANPAARRTLILIGLDRILIGLSRILIGLDRVAVRSTQTGIGSLLGLAADGSGVLYQPGFTLEGGVRGRTFAVAGATMQIEPETLNLRSRGRYISVSIEAANGGSRSIIASSIEVQVEGVAGAIPIDDSFRPHLEDGDDGNPELLVKFDRADVIRLLRNVPDDQAVVHATWNYADGRGGSASANIRLTR
jgi:hypothetical protein